jgi:hypothetical protein
MWDDYDRQINPVFPPLTGGKTKETFIPIETVVDGSLPWIYAFRIPIEDFYTYPQALL